MQNRAGWTRIGVAVVACALVTGAWAGDRAADEPPGSSAESAEPLGRRLDEAILRHGLGQFWGAVVVAREGEPVLVKGYGLADDSLRPIDADTLFDIGSVAKQFTAAAVLRLEQAGVLSTSDPVSKFYPGLPGVAKKVTLAHLLSHTSGMSDEVAIQNLGFDDRDEAVRLAMSSAFKAEPGRAFDYCNAGYIVLAAVIEKATGKKYEDVVRAEVFAPAGMKSSGFLDGVGLDSSKQTVRVITGRGPRAIRTTLFAGSVEPWAWGLRGAGGVLTTPNDLVRWERALAGESVLNAESKKKLWTPGLSNYGMGWFIETTARGTRRVQHTGGTRGFVSLLEMFPDEGLVVAVLTNDRGNPFEMEKLVAGVLFGESGGIEGRLTVGNLPKNQYGTVDAEDGVEVEVEPAGTAKVKLAVRVRGELGAEVVMASGQAKMLASQIAGFAAGRSKETAPKPKSVRELPGVNPSASPDAGRPAGGAGGGAAGPEPKGIAAFIGTAPYAAVEGVVTLPRTVEWMVMPQYVGVDENGNRNVDRRITVVLKDEDNGFWPLILRLDAEAAERLVKELGEDGK